MFYLFGSVGFIWIFVWMYCYRENRGTQDEEFVDPPKVSSVAQLSRVMRKPAFCICESKDTDQLPGKACFTLIVRPF